MFEVGAACVSEKSGKSLGIILAEARRARNLPIEQVARETRIRAQRLREVESDDFSQFAHPSYVRMFLRDYSKYLGIDLAEIEDYLPDKGGCGTAGYQYLQEISREEVVPYMRRSASRHRLLPIVLSAAAILICAMVGFRLWMDIDRLGLGRVATTEKVISITTPSVDSESDEAWKADKQMLNEVGGEAAPAFSQPVANPPSMEADQATGFAPSPISAAIQPVSSALFVGGAVEHAGSLR